MEGGANFSWTVTFLTEWPAATDSRLVLDAAGLYSVNSTVRARVGARLEPDAPGHRLTIANATVKSGSAVVRTAYADAVRATDWMAIGGGVYQVPTASEPFLTRERERETRDHRRSPR